MALVTRMAEAPAPNGPRRPSEVPEVASAGLPRLETPPAPPAVQMAEDLALAMKMDLIRLQEIDATIDEMARRENPATYGLPDLMFPRLMYEPLEQFQARQDAALKAMVEKHLWVEKDGLTIPIVLIPEMLEFIADLFFGRVQFAILWKSRGGGGSLAASIVIWLRMVYWKQSWMDMGGSGEQAKVVYEYTVQFWKCVGGMPDRFLRGDPTLSKTESVNGATLSCVACSDKAVRGKHKGGFCGDESCQKDEGSGQIFEAAMQGAFSEKDPVIMLMSTFHWPFGFFKDYWDGAPDKGFKRYKWDVFDTMKQCHLGMETATKEDTKALNYCRTVCPLTSKREVRGEDGKVLDVIFEECNGKARDSRGFQEFKNVLANKTLNAGGDMWRIEFCCQRPKVRGNVVQPEAIESACTKTPAVPVVVRREIRQRDGTMRVDVEKPQLSVGLDWGLMGMAVAVLSGPCEGGGIAAFEAKCFVDSESAHEIADVIKGWAKKYDRHIVVYPDAEETYGNQQLELEGLEVTPVHFSTWKHWGYDNLNLWLDYRRLKLVETGDMERIVVPQLKGLHKSANTGKIVKKDDHGPDALMCSIVCYDFLEMASSLVAKQIRNLAGDAEEKPKEQLGDSSVELI